MATRGPKPKKIVTRIQNRQPVGTATPAKGTPTKPPHLTGAASTEWDYVADLLQAMGTLSTADGRILASYCELYARWLDALELIKVKGLTITSSKTGWVTPSPYLTIAQQSEREMMRHLVEMGLTPSARNRVQQVKSPEAKSKLEKFIGGE